MKQLIIAAIILHLLVISDAGYAQKQPEEILKAVVKVRAVIPDSALTAPLLGTEREGNGILIDSNGYILTIGYLILEAERIEVIDPEDKVLETKFIAYDYDTGFTRLSPENPSGFRSSPPLRGADPYGTGVYSAIGLYIII